MTDAPGAPFDVAPVGVALVDAGLVGVALVGVGLVDAGLVDAGLVDAGLVDVPSLDAAAVDVVIVTYQSQDHIAACLDSLIGAAGVGSVVVVDNDSTDETATIVGARPGVTWCPTGTNRGFGSAANRGLALTTSPFVVVANADTVFAPGCVAALGDRLRREACLAVCGPEIRLPDGSPYPSSRSFPSPLGAAAHAAFGGVWPSNPWTRRYHHPGVPDWVSGTAIGVRRAAWEELGGFDEAFFMYLEDVDLCWRAREGGWRIGVEPAAVVTHEVGGSSTGAPVRLIAAHHRSAFRFWWRSAPARQRPLAPVVAGGLVVRGAVASGVAWRRSAKAARDPSGRPLT